jgi:hypothetical protein
MTTWLFPYPRQLPQDYYSKNLPTPVAPPVAVAPPPTAALPIAPPSQTVNSGGVYYGPSPPPNPEFGWLWTMGQGRLFVYIEPGIWTQVATNW